MLFSKIEKYGGSKELADALQGAGISEFYPPQELALRAGLLYGDNSIVVAAPTASGKTLIAAMAALKVALQKRGKAVYLVPLKALAREKYDYFKEKYPDIRVTLSTGDYDSMEPWLQASDLVITTNEKMDSLIRHRAPWLKDLRLLVADEIHLLGDPSRGPTLEVVITRLMSMERSMRVIALSATIPNCEEIAQWLGAELVQSDWRPVPLKEGVYFNRAVIFNDGSVKWSVPVSSSDAVDLALDTVKEGGQALIFVNTRKSSEAVARKAAEYLEEEKSSLSELHDAVLGATSEPTKLCRKLAECVERGSAFHHAGINYSQRKIVEDAFREGKIKIIAATTTLAMGLNLPSRRVVIRDWYRYEPGLGLRGLPAIEIKQMSGRAGRPGYDEYGESVIIAKNKRDERQLFKQYIEGGPERIDSRLGNESALRTHLLSSVAGLFTRDREGLLEFLNNTFFARREGPDYLTGIMDDILSFLSAEDMITEKGGSLTATRFGRRVSELYIDPLTGVILRDALRRPEKKDPFPLFHMIARAPDMMHLRLAKKDYDEMLDVYHVHAASLLVSDEGRCLSEGILSELKTASALMQWIIETPEDGITGHFGIGPGDLRTLVGLTDWLLYSAQEIGRVFGLKDLNILPLRARVKYGIKEELIELVSLRGVGRVRARNLHDAGYKTLNAIKEADVKMLSLVHAVGGSIAESIKKQVSEEAPSPEEN